MTTLLYCRVSTQGQSDDGTSLGTQADACAAYAKENKLTVSRTVKEVFSGAYLFDRPKLNAIRDEVRAGRWEHIVVYAIDRLTRNIAHLMILLEECERYGTQLHFVTESLDNTAEGKLLLSVKGYVGEVEREKIRERTMRGRRAKVTNGTINFNRKLYGYTVLDSKRQLCPYEAPVALSLFQRLKSGDSLREIAADLNERSVPTPAGREGAVWWANTVASIVKNPAYAGRTVAFRYSHEQKFVEGRRSVTCKTTEESLWVDLPDDLTPAIVDQETFDAVQAALASNKINKRRRIRREFLLRGMIRCATCGRGMSPTTSHSSFRSYVCTSKQNKTTNCKTKMLKAESGESAVWSEISLLIREPERLMNRIIASANSDGSNGDALRDELKSIQSTITRTETEMSNLVRRAETSDDAMWKMFESRLKIKQGELDNLATLRRTIQKELKVIETAQVDLRDFEMNRLRMLDTLDAMTFEDRVDVLKEFGLGIRWDGTKLKASVYTQYGCKGNFNSVYNNTVAIEIDPVNTERPEHFGVLGSS